FVVPVQLFDVRPFRLDAYHLRGELAAGEIADPEVANKRPWRCELELSFVGMTYVSVEHEWVPPVGAEANLTRLCEVTAYGALFRRGDEGAAPSSRGANHDWKLSCMATTGPSEASNPLPTRTRRGGSGSSAARTIAPATGSGSGPSSMSLMCWG